MPASLPGTSVEECDAQSAPFSPPAHCIVLLAPPTSNTLLERVSRGSSWRTLRQCDLVATQTWLGSHILGVEAARQFLGVDVDVDVDVV